MNILQKAEALARDVETDVDALWKEFEEFVRTRFKKQVAKEAAAAQPKATVSDAKAS